MSDNTDLVVYEQNPVVAYQPHAFSAFTHFKQANAGQSVGDMVRALQLPEAYDGYVHVWLNDMPVAPEEWDRVVPLEGEMVYVRVVPQGRSGKDILRVVLAIAIVVVSVATGQLYGAQVGAALNTTAAVGTAIVTAAVTIIGNLALNALIPPPKPDFDLGGGLGSRKNQLTGSSNRYAPYAPIPRIFGRRRVYPLLAGRPYSETQGDDEYLRMALLVGWGPLQISDIRIGDTPLASFEGVQYEVREGWSTDTPVTLYNRTVNEEGFNILLDPPSGGPIYSTRTTSTNTTEISVDITAPSGIAKFESDGKRSLINVDVQVQYSAAGANSWQTPTWINSTDEGLSIAGRIRVSGKDTTSIRRTGRFTVAAGQYDVRIYRSTGQFDVTKHVQEVRWTTMRSIQPSYPVLQTGVALIALRIKATGQLNGVPQVINCLAESYLPVYDGTENLMTRSQEIDSSAWIKEAGATVTANAGTAPNSTTTAEQLSASVANRGTYQVVTGSNSTTYTASIYAKAGTATSLYFGLTNQNESARVYYTFNLSNGTVAAYTSTGMTGATATITSAGSGWYRCVVTATTPSSGTTSIGLFPRVPVIGNVLLWGAQLELGSTAKTYHATTFPAKSLWVYTITRNPAWAFADVLRRRGGETYLSDDRLDLASILSWANACSTTAPNAVESYWNFDGVVEGGSIFQVLRQIANSARANYIIRDGKHSVVRDVQQTTPIQHITPRNSSNYSGSKIFLDYPHALRVVFPNADKNYEEDERIVYDDGYTSANATKFETLELYGCTSATQAWREGRYHIASARLRPEEHVVQMDVENVRCNLGDLVQFQHDVISIGIASARVVSLTLNGSNQIISITLDYEVPIETTKSYALRARKADGTSVVIPLTSPANTNTTVVSLVTPLAAASGPEVGDLVMYGEAASVSASMIVKKIEAGPDLSAKLYLVDAQSGVYTADTGSIPAFNSNITIVRPVEETRPYQVTISALRSDESALLQLADGTLQDRIAITLGTTPSTEVSVDTFEVQWREDGAAVWNTARFPRGAPLYATPVQGGTTYQLRVRAVSTYGVAGDWSVTSTHTVVGKLAAPGDVTGFAYVSTEAGINFSWTPAVDIDYAATVIKSGASWATATELFRGNASKWTLVRPASASYTILAKHVDTVGNESANVATLSINYTSAGINNSSVTINTDGSLSGGGGGQANLANIPGTIGSTQVADSAITSAKIADAALTTAKFASTIEPVSIVTGSLPTVKSTNAIYLTSDGKIYRWNGTAYTSASGVSAFSELTGSIATSQIPDSAVTAAKIADASISTAKFASTIEPISIVTGSLPTVKSTNTIYLTSDGKIYRWNGTAYTSASGVSAFSELTGSIATSQIPDSAVTSAKIADAAISTAKFANGIEPVEIVAALPSTGNFQGRIAFLTTDNKLYRYNGTAWVASVPTADLTGTIASAQIADSAVTAAKIADATLTTAKFASTIEPVSVVTSVPGTKSTNTIFNTTDGKLYRWNGSAYVASVATADLSGTIGSTQIADSAVTAAKIADAALTTAKFATSIEPVSVVSAVPGTKSTNTVFNTTDGKLYRWNGSAYVASVATADLSGTVGTTQIADSAVTNAKIADSALTTAKFASSIEPVSVVAAVPGTKSTNTIFNTTDGKLYRWNGSSYVATVPTGDLSGTVASAQIADSAVTSAKIADASLTTAKFASSIEPVSVVTSVPGAKTTNTVFNTTDGKLYRWNGSSYVATVPTADLSGTVTDAQIAGLAASKVTGTLSDSQLAGISAAKVTGTLTASQLSVTIGGGNLLSNSGFETGDLTGWLASGAFSASSSTAQKLSGSRSAALTHTVSGQDTYLYVRLTNPLPNTKYVFSAWVYVSSITGGAVGNRSILAYDGAVSQADTTLSSSHPTGVWTRKVVLLTTSASPTYLEIRIYAPNGTVYWDNCQIEFGDIATAYAPRPDEILPNTITTTQISDDAVTSAKVVAGAIVAGKIAAGAVSATEIAAGAITTAKLAAGAVTSNEIAANTIVAADIASGTITATEIASGAITTAKLAAGAVTANEIAASTITGGKIAGSTITASNIAADTITAGQIAAGAIGASEIAAKVITADKLVLTNSNNVISNPVMAYGTSGYSPDSASYITAVAAASAPANCPTANAMRQTVLDVYSEWFDVFPGEVYNVGVTAAASAGVTSANFGLGFRLWYSSGNTSDWQDASGTAVGTFPSGGAWTTASGQFTVPSTVIKMSVWLHAEGYRTNTNPQPWFWTNLRVTRAATAELIVDGSIQTNKLAANAVTAAKIAANTITASQIASGTITSTQIAADTITAGQIAAGAISTSELASNAVTAAKIAAGTITATEIASSTITSTQIASNTITGTNIAGSTITGTNIAGSTITASNIAADTITAGQIAAGAVTADEVAANAITTAKLLVTGRGSALNDDPFTSDASAWPSTGLWSATWSIVTITDGPSGSKAIRATSGSSQSYAASRHIAFNPNKAYRVRCKARNVGTNGSFYLVVDLRDSAGAVISGDGTAWYYPASGVAVPSSWTDYEGRFGFGTDRPFPSNARTMSVGALMNYNATAGYHEVQDLRIEEMADASLIVDGAVIASKVAAGAITTAKLAAGAVTANEIAASTITGNKIAGSTITASNIAADTITAGQIAAGAIGASEIAAGAVTTGKLLVTGRGKAINEDPTFLDSSAWTSDAGSFVLADESSAPVGTRVLRATNGTRVYSIPVGGLPVESGKQYKVSMWGRQISGGGVMYLRLYCYNNAGSLQNYIVTALSPAVGTFEGIALPSSWTKYTGYITPAASSVRATLIIHLNWNVTGVSEIADARVEEYIGADLIVDGAISASKIAANTITASQIASATITGTQIAGSTITASNIAADTITAGQIAAGAISASELAAGAVTTAKLAAGAVTANEIAANTITASQIASATITGTLIAGSTITGSNIAADTITAGQIAAGAVSASEIAASAITTDKLYVSGRGTAINDDPNTQDITAWTGSGLSIITDNTSPVGNTVLRCATLGDTILSRRFPLDPSRNYEFRIWTRQETGSSTTYLTVGFFNASDVVISGGTTGWSTGTYHYFGLVNAALPASWTEYRISFGPNESATIPAGAKYIRVGLLSNYTGTGTQLATGIRLMLKADADLIVDGAILTNKLAANAVTAAKIAANTITASQIAASTITGTQIAGSTITASNIASDTITAGQIAAGAISTSELASNAVTAAKIAANTITANEIAANTITAGQIASATITATQIASGTITATQIASSTITASQIAAGTITSSQIAANTITGSNIAADTITSTKIDSRNLTIKDANGNIIFSASSVTGSGNICRNGDFLLSSSGLPTHFTNYNNGGVSLTNTVNAGGPIQNSNYWRITVNSTGSTQFGFYFLNAADAFGGWKANTKYVVSFYARCSAYAGATMYSAWNNTPPVNVPLQNPGISTNWQRYVWLIDFQNSAIDGNGFWSISQGSLAVGTTLDFACIQVEQGDAPSGWAPAPLSSLNPINSTNVGTYVASAAIGWAQIGNLVIDSAGAIRSGKTGFSDDTNSGWWIGNDSGTPKFKIGSGSGNRMFWDGSALKIEYQQENVVSQGVKSIGLFSSSEGATGTITATLSWNTNGTSNGGPNWYDPTTTNIGASYWIKLIRTGGVGTLTGATLNTWLQLNSQRSLSTSRSVDGENNIYGSYQISSSSSGTPVLATGDWELYVLRGIAP